MGKTKFDKTGFECTKLEKTETEKKDGGITEKYVAEFKAGDAKVVITSPNALDEFVVGLSSYEVTVTNTQAKLD